MQERPLSRPRYILLPMTELTDAELLEAAAGGSRDALGQIAGGPMPGTWSSSSAMTARTLAPTPLGSAW